MRGGFFSGSLFASGELAKYQYDELGLAGDAGGE
jgi:hypothetical protein